MNQFLFQAEKVEDCRSGVPHIISNIQICESIRDFLATSLGPYGLDKLFYGKKLTMTNDGATIMSQMNYKHPVAKMLVSLSNSQDKEVGDGTTSVIILAAEILSCLKPLIIDKFPIQKIIRNLQFLQKKCIEKIDSLKITLTDDTLIKLAETSMNSKSIRNSKSHFANLLVQGLKSNEPLYISKIPGGSIADSFIVNGIAFEKPFTYAGYEQQPKKIINPKVCCLNVELEWKSERDNAEIRIDSVEEYQKVVDAEWAIIKEKLDDIINSGANVVLSSLPIGDYATQYFASKNVFSAGRVKCLNQIISSFGGKISTSTKYLSLIECDLYEERQIGNFRYNYLEGEKAATHTLILRGPGAEALDEIERAIHDAICVINKALSNHSIVTGGGSVEMELSKYCKILTNEVNSEEILVLKAISKAFEKIPLQLAINMGLDSTSFIQKLRRAHMNDPCAGISINGIENMQNIGIYESLDVKKNMIKASFSCAESILMINSTIISPK